jgi:UDP-GlcNAc:undecaprenyl-phosphate GlcNAc-1-phosphate transferase
MSIIYTQLAYSIISTYFLLIASPMIAKKINLIDKPSKVNIHKTEVPLTGGILLLNLFISTLISLYFLEVLLDRVFISLIISLIIFFIIGLIDDTSNISGHKRIIFFWGGSLFFIVASGFYSDLTKIFFINVNFSLNIGLWGIFFFSLCMTGLQIVLNLIDGINGLLKIYFLIVLCIIEILLTGNLSLMTKFIFPAMILMIIYNFKNKFFLGSSGNAILSLIISFVLLNALSNHDNPIFFEEILLLFLIPFTDCLRLFLYRIKKFKNIFVKQKNHFHHLLMNRYDLQSSLLIYYLLSFGPVIIYLSFNLNIYVLIFSKLLIYFCLILYLKKHEVNRIAF